MPTEEDGGGFLHGGCRLRRTAEEVFCIQVRRLQTAEDGGVFVLSCSEGDSGSWEDGGRNVVSSFF